jgi:curved DNA-binding protein
MRWSATNGSGAEEFHFGGTGFSDFFEQFFGQGRRANGFDGMFQRGSATEFANEPPEYAQRGGDIEGDILVTLDEVLHGSVRNLTLRRTDPRTGEGDTETFKVRIPPGAQDARRIRVPGKGQPGIGDAPPGDLYLRVRIAAHPDFDVRGADLYYDVDLAPWEAVLGAQVIIPTLEGSIKLRVPPGTTTAQELRVRGRGLPRGKGAERGDLYAVIRVQTPAEVTPDEKELWEKLSRTSRFNPREQ